MTCHDRFGGTDDNSAAMDRDPRLQAGPLPYVHCRSPRTSAAQALALAIGAALSVPAAAGSTWVVNTSSDPGPMGTLSLRQAVASAINDDTISFAPALVGATITLAQGQIPLVSKAIRIEGPGEKRLTISGGGASRIFKIYSNSNNLAYAGISGVTLTGGANVDCGGAIYVGGSHGVVKLDATTIADNSADKFGGGLCIAGGANAYLYDVQVSGNSARQFGGGILASSDSFLVVRRSSVTRNQIVPTGSGDNGGGGIAAYNIYSMYMLNTTIAENYAPYKGGGMRFLDAVSGNNAHLSFVTIADNFTSADSAGNGIFADAGRPTIASSILAGNSSQGGDNDLSGAFLVNGSLIVSPGNASFALGSSGNLLGVDPKLGALADNGGNGTLCKLPQPGSPVIGASVLGSSSSDQRGYPRPAGPTDIGAVERQNPEDLVFRSGFDSG